MNRQKAINVGKSFFKSICYPFLHKGNVPMWVHLWVTRKCNLTCKYCYVYDNNYPELTTEGMIQAIDHVKDTLECNLIALMGGEPTIRRDLPEIIQHMTDRAVSSYMTTNGMLLADKKIYEICEAGLDVLELSFDAMTESEVSQKAGQKLIGTIERLLEFRDIYDVELSVNMVITRQNYQELDDVIALLANKRISLTTGLYIPDPFLKGDPRKDPLAFGTPQDLQILQKIVNKILRLKKRGVFIAHDPSYYKKWVPFMHQLITPAQRRHPTTLWRCDPGPNFLEVDCDGRIRFCSYLNLAVSPNLTLFDLDKSYYHVLKPQITKMLRYCNARCLANCFYQVAEIRRHPIRFATDTLIRHMAPQLRNTPEKQVWKQAQKQMLRQKFGSRATKEIDPQIQLE